MADLERFEMYLAAMLYLSDVDNHVGVPADELARKTMEYYGIVKACHEQDRDIELTVAPDHRPLLPPHLEEIIKHE